MSKRVRATVELVQGLDGVFLWVISPTCQHGAINLTALNLGPITRAAFDEWVASQFNSPDKQQDKLLDGVRSIADQIWQGLLTRCEAADALYALRQSVLPDGA